MWAVPNDFHDFRLQNIPARYSPALLQASLRQKNAPALYLQSNHPATKSPAAVFPESHVTVARYFFHNSTNVYPKERPVHVPLSACPCKFHTAYTEIFAAPVFARQHREWQCPVARRLLLALIFNLSLLYFYYYIFITTFSLSYLSAQIFHKISLPLVN